MATGRCAHNSSSSHSTSAGTDLRGWRLQHAIPSRWPGWSSSSGFQPAGRSRAALGGKLPERVSLESQAARSIEASRRCASWSDVRSEPSHQSAQCQSHHPLTSESQTRS
jgi:hypothetical protein